MNNIQEKVTVFTNAGLNLFKCATDLIETVTANFKSEVKVEAPKAPLTPTKPGYKIYACISLDAQGNEVRKDIEAESQYQAIAILRQDGMYPTSVTEIV